MKLKRYLDETSIRGSQNPGMGADGLSKQRLKTMIYKAIKKFTHNKVYHDTYWEGPQDIWNAFGELDLNWSFSASPQYKHEKGYTMPVRKEWYFEIFWQNDKGKQMKLGGMLTAAGAGSVDEPLERYDLVFIIY